MIAARLLGALAPADAADELAFELELEARTLAPLARAAFCATQLAGSALPLLALRARRRGLEDVALGRAAALALPVTLLLAASLHAVLDFARASVPLRAGTEPLPSFLVAVALLVPLPAGAAAAWLARTGVVRPSQPVLLGLAAALAATAALPLSTATFPLWYLTAPWLLGPGAAFAAARLAAGASR